ncbi:AraC family transcriptional regulator [Paenibacillus sp. N4]|uniref:helix-turn-helix domain-containing protein n=1 Tax=Paenibacillus vietnamensis TaxID=2590547 RepID=UPI001CD0D2BE|nr:helix-turn-helix domain-containing protein [Paenibacillus vietnamensis]MCA0757278.1 AraC family transcriptional regulator [Paenibacillus vietnamensis]
MRGERQLKFRFFMSLTLISACSVLVLASALFFWFREKTVDHVNQVNESVLLNTETVFTKYMDMVQNYTMDFYRNPNINTVMQSGDNNWSNQLYSALSQMRGTITVNAFLENAYIMGQDGPALMFENNPLSPSAKRELFELVRDSEIKQSPFVWNATLNSGEREKLMTLFYNDRAFGSSEYHGAIAMTVNLRKLQENIFGSSGDGDTRYAILDAGGLLLMQSGLPGVSFDEAMLRHIASGTSKAGTLIWKDGSGARKLVAYRQAQHGGLWFLSETSYKNSVRDIANALKLMIGLSLALIAAAAAAAAFVSHRMYKPIGTLFGNIRSLSGDRLAFAKGGGFDEANRELERIAGEFGELKREKEDSALLRWLTSPYRSGDQLPSALPPLQDSSGSAAFCVAVLQLNHAGTDNEMPDEEKIEKIKSLPQLTERLFDGKAACRGFFPHPDAAVLIVSETESGSFGDYGLIRERWEQLDEELRSWSGTACSIGVSRLSADTGQLKQLYDEANDSLQYRKLRSSAAVIYADDTIHLNGSPMPDSSLEAVLQIVRNREQELIPGAIERLLAAAGSYRAGQATIALSRLALELDKIGDTGLANGIARHSDFLVHYQRIWRISDYAELGAWLEQLCLNACEKLNELNTVQTRSAADEAIAYIRKHYNDPTLSLNGLADKLAISPPYLSRMITEATGSSFPDFVHLVRLEHARALLISDPELDIREIAEKSGYSSSTYFTTLFKKRYGVTPSKWRLNHILQQND